MMKLFAVCLAFAALAFGQDAKPVIPPTGSGGGPPVAAPTPITGDAERLLVLDAYSAFAKLSDKEKEVSDGIMSTELGKKRANLISQATEIKANLDRLNAEIAETPLGKELAEVQRQEKGFSKKFNDAVGPVMKTHNCENGRVLLSLELKDCDKPPATPEQ